MVKKLLLFGFVFLMLSSFSFAIDDTNLISYYSFDSSRTDDEHGSIDFGLEGTVTSSSTAKLGAKSDYMNAVGGISANNNAHGLTTSFCINFWTRMDTIPTESAWVGRTESTAYVGQPTMSHGSGQIYAGTWGGSAWERDNAVWSPSTDTWYMMTLKWDNNAYSSSWINGAILTNSSNSDITTYSANADISIGRAYNNVYTIDGYIDELSIWSECSNQDIIDLYNGGSGLTLSSISPSLVTTYAFDIHAENGTSSLTNFNASVTNNGTTYEYITTNGTINTNSTDTWADGNFNVTISASGYEDWEIRQFYWDDTQNSIIYPILTLTPILSQDCTGYLIVNAGCEAIMNKGFTW